MPALPRVNDYSFWKALKGTYNGGNARYVEITCRRSQKETREVEIATEKARRKDEFVKE